MTMCRLFLSSLQRAAIVCLAIASAARTSSGSVSDSWDHARAERLLATLIGSAPGQCGSCHAADINTVVRWSNAAEEIRSCIRRASSALTRIECLQVSSTNMPLYNPSKLGLYAAGAHTDIIKELLFSAAYPNGNEAERAQAELVRQAGMPIDPTLRMSESDFGEVMAWLTSGRPYLNDFLKPDPQQPCIDKIEPAYQTYLADKKANGWGARHREAALPMFGCNVGQNADSCLQSRPDLTATIGAPNVIQSIRQLIDLPRKSQYWVRSSADGRYVAFGGEPSGILDLEAASTGRGATEFFVAAYFDPGFSADNLGFIFVDGRGIQFCKQSLLTRLGATLQPSITFWEPECIVTGMGSYQSFGASLSGDRFLMVMGDYISDVGGWGGQGGNFMQKATVRVSVFNSDGLSFQNAGTSTVSHPFHSEPILSPSGGAIVSRFGSNGSQSGYDVSILDATIAPGHTEINLRKGAQVCTTGEKASFSMDERFIVTHRYVDRRPTKSDIMLTDLSNGQTTQLTNMPIGTYALFPHFRADNWIYFLVKDDHAREYVAASSAAIAIGGQPTP